MGIDPRGLRNTIDDYEARLEAKDAHIAKLEAERDRYRELAVRAYGELGWGCDFATVEDLLKMENRDGNERHK